jgi:uncharacterized protein (DUF427 family)
MARALLNDMILAESETTEVVEGNTYFPRKAVDMSRLEKSDTRYTCPWKGDATYYNLVTSTSTVEDIAWSYPNPKPAASSIAGHLAFDAGKGIRVEK